MYKKGIYKILANEPLTATVWRMVLGGTRSGSPPRAVRRHRPRRPLPAPSDLGLRLRRHDAHAHLQGGGRGNRTDEPYGCGRGARPADGARQRVRRAQCRTASPAGGRRRRRAPLYNLAKVLLAAGKRVGVVLGFNTADEVFYADEFRALGCDVHLATADGSAGVRGSSRRPSPSAAPSSTISMPAGRCRCCGHCATLCRRTGSSRSKSAWAAVSGPAWAVRAKPNTATSASARRGPY